MSERPYTIQLTDDPEENRRRVEQVLKEISSGLLPLASRLTPIFEDGEVLPMHEFIARFRRDLCGGSEIRFWQWPVAIKTERQPDGSVTLTLTTSWRSE